MSSVVKIYSLDLSIYDISKIYDVKAIRQDSVETKTNSKK